MQRFKKAALFTVLVALTLILASCSLDELGNTLQKMGKNVFGSLKVDLSFATDKDKLLEDGGETGKKKLSPASDEDYNALIDAYNKNKGQLNDMKKQKLGEGEENSDLKDAVKDSAKGLKEKFGFTTDKEEIPETGNEEIDGLLQSLLDTFNQLESDPGKSSFGDVMALRVVQSKLDDVDKKLKEFGLGDNLEDFIEKVGSGELEITEELLGKEGIVDFLGEITTMLDVLSECSDFLGGKNVSSLLSGFLSGLNGETT